MDCGTPGFAVHHHLPDLTQTQEAEVEWFYENLQDLLELTTKKDVLFIIGNAKECSNYHTIALISHTSKVMLKILQAKLQHYMNRELREVQAGFRKCRGTRDQIANLCWIIKNTRVPEKHLLLLY